MENSKNKLRDVQLQCSPNTFRKIQTDEAYKEHVTNEILSQSQDYIPNIIVSEISPVIEDTKEGAIWLEAPTKFLLDKLEELMPKVGKCLSLKNKTKMWQSITDALCKEGYHFTISQVQGKYRTLERRYKQSKLHNNKTGMDRVTCPFERELDKIFREKRGVYPEHLLDETMVEGISREERIAMAGTSSQARHLNTSDDEAYSPVSKKPRNAAQRDVTRILEEMKKDRREYQAERRDYHAQVLQRLDRVIQLDEDKLNFFKEMVEKEKK